MTGANAGSLRKERDGWGYFPEAGLAQCSASTGWVLSVPAEYNPLGLGNTGLGTGASPSKSLAWSELSAVCFELSSLDTTFVSLGRDEEAKEQQKFSVSHSMGVAYQAYARLYLGVVRRSTDRRHG